MHPRIGPRLCRTIFASVAVALSASACSSSDPAGPGLTTPGFRFAYTDTLGRKLVLEADSGTWSIDPVDSTVFTNLYASPSGFLLSPVQLQFSTSLVAPGTRRIPVGSYTPHDTLNLNLDMEVYGGLRGYAIGGVVTITRSDSVVLEGTLNLQFSRESTPLHGPPFTLKGPFRLTNHP